MDAGAAEIGEHPGGQTEDAALPSALKKPHGHHQRRQEHGPHPEGGHMDEHRLLQKQEEHQQHGVEGAPAGAAPNSDELFHYSMTSKSLMMNTCEREPRLMWGSTTA